MTPQIQWILNLFTETTLTQTLMVYGLVVALGLFFSRIRFKGISIGVTWVLLMGMVASALGLKVDHNVLYFLKDFGLVLFVYCIGLQVGPGFFASLKKSAVHFNFLAGSVVVLGFGVTLALHYLFNQPIPLLAGIMSGAVTNTPGLGAAQAAVNDLHILDPSSSQMALAYAMSYPFGIGGLILSILLVKVFFRIDLKTETQRYKESNALGARPLSVHLSLDNPSLSGQPLRSLLSLISKPIVVSRMLQNGKILTPTPDTLLTLGDTLLIVTPVEQLHALQLLVGKESSVNLKESPESELISRILVVTRSEITHRRLGDLPEFHQNDFTLTRLSRAGIEMVPHGNMILQLGDQLKVVGNRAGVEAAAVAVGKSMQRLEVPDLAPIFIGIVLGLILGSIPFYFPSVSVPIKLGVAGGPLLVALMMSKLGSRFYLNTYTTRSANLMVREMGISLFLASIGLSSGDQLFHALQSSTSFEWIGMGLLITFIPLLTVGVVARIFFKKTYLEICGLLAGSCTDPPALAFAMEYTGSEAPSIVYATVYPMTMILRIIAAEALILLFRN